MIVWALAFQARKYRMRITVIEACMKVMNYQYKKKGHPFGVAFNHLASSSNYCSTLCATTSPLEKPTRTVQTHLLKVRRHRPG